MDVRRICDDPARNPEPSDDGLSMTSFDYVIVGAAGGMCARQPALRGSWGHGVSVLLVEAGDADTNPLIAMPRGFGELLGDPTTAWHYPTRPFGPSRQVEYWVRGKTLGGSSSINGMVYNRGNRADYDALERLGNPGWGWDDMLRAYTTIEDNALGASEDRGAGGPLHVSTVDGTDPLLEDVLTAGTQLGWRRMRDYNESDEERIGYAMATIRNGRRVSAANAFLHPVMDRPNLTVALRTLVARVVLEGGEAIGVQARQDGQSFEALATREVILATGSIATPKILQLSGIGPADTLRSAGVEVVVDSPNVGARAREHRVFLLQFRLAEDLGYNKLLSTEAGHQLAGISARDDLRSLVAELRRRGTVGTHPTGEGDQERTDARDSPPAHVGSDGERYRKLAHWRTRVDQRPVVTPEARRPLPRSEPSPRGTRMVPSSPGPRPARPARRATAPAAGVRRSPGRGPPRGSGAAGPSPTGQSGTRSRRRPRGPSLQRTSSAGERERASAAAGRDHHRHAVRGSRAARAAARRRGRGERPARGGGVGMGGHRHPS